MSSYDALTYDYITQATRTEVVSAAPNTGYAVTMVGTSNANGNYNGTGNPQTIFTVSGQVLISVIAVCSTTLVGTSATLELGNSTSAARYLPSLTATTLVAGKTWDITGLVSAGTPPKTAPSQVAFNGENIIATVGTANITAGALIYYAFWQPLTAGAAVTAA